MSVSSDDSQCVQTASTGPTAESSCLPALSAGCLNLPPVSCVLSAYLVRPSLVSVGTQRHRFLLHQLPNPAMQPFHHEHDDEKLYGLHGSMQSHVHYCVIRSSKVGKAASLYR